MSKDKGSKPRVYTKDATVRLDDAARIVKSATEELKSTFRPVLVVLSGELRGERITVDGNVTIGRDPEAELRITDAGVSWRHAYIEDRGESWAVVDANSTNGTAVNGTPVEDRVLTSGDKIAFGNTLVRFEVQDAADREYDDYVSRLVSIDDLSGLLLRRRFDQVLARLVNESRLRGEPLALLAMDLDGIKQINDTHGHAFGAYTIGESGRVIGREVSSIGVACRWGGDEFLAALRQTDIERAEEVAERIRKAIGTHPFEHEEVVLNPGISIGVAAFPAQAQDPHDLFRAADGALYRAKRGGRDRVSR